MKRYLMENRFAVAVLVCFVLLLAFSSNAQALMLEMSAEDLAGGADSIIVGTVTGFSSSWNSEKTKIYTEVRVVVEENHKGPAGRNEVTVIVPGGRVGEITHWVEDAPCFIVGERVKMYLKKADAAGLRTMGREDGTSILSPGAMTVHGQYQGKIEIAGVQDGSSLRSFSEKEVAQASPIRRPAIIGITYDHSISSISPYEASAGTHTLVTITGGGFGTRGEADHVFFFYKESDGLWWFMSSDIDLWSDTQIKARVPVMYESFFPGFSCGYPEAAASGPFYVCKDNNVWSNFMPRATTFGYGGAKWPGNKPIVDYLVDTGGVSGRLAAIRAAADTWNEAGATFRFNYAGSPADLDGSNRVQWASLPEGCLAQAEIYYMYNSILFADITFNDAYSWSTEPTCGDGKYDLQSIAAHEFGHWLNLTDLYGECSGYPQDVDKIMFGRGSPGKIKRNLHPHDILGINWVYPNYCGIGLYSQPEGKYYLKDTPYAGVADRSFYYGPRGNNWLPATGDWNGSGVHGISLYDQVKGAFLIKDTPSAGVADRTFRYGPLNNKWIPVAGDWTGDGVFGVALYDQKTGTFLIKDTPYAGVADRTFRYGPVNNNMIPVAGDWTGDGVFGVALYDQKTGTFYIKDTPYAGVADRTFRYGPANNNMIPVAGDWAGCGMHGVALYDQKTGTFLIKDTPYAGVADRTFRYGPLNNNWLPVSGVW